MTLVRRIDHLTARARRWLLRGQRLPIFLGLLVTWFVVLLFTADARGIRDLRARLDNMVYDQRYALAPRPPAIDAYNIVIVDIDQKSLEVEGQWPWSRFTLGTLVSRLAAHGAAVVGFDAFFPEVERNLAGELEKRLAAGDVAKGAADLLARLQDFSELMDADRYFAQSMSEVDVVLGFSLLADATSRSGMLPQPVIEVADAGIDELALRSMQGYVGNVEVLQTAAAGGGFFDTVPDVDGVLRRTPLVMHYRNGIYPSLALDMARVFFFETDFALDVEGDAAGNNRALQGITMGRVYIPTDEQGNVLVPFAGPAGSYPYLSATDVIRDALTAEQEALLGNSLVLVGATATGLYDLRATPVQAVFPGVEIHANVLNAILQSSPSTVIGESSVEAASRPGNADTAFGRSGQSPFPTRPDWEDGAVLLAILVIGLALSLLYPRLGPAMLVLSSVMAMGGMILLNVHLWQRYGLDISLVILLLLILLIAIANLGFGFLREGLNRKVIKGMFDQYVPPAHIDAMLDDPDKYNFEGESREMSVLFSDIRNFTAISENLSAVELKRLLNDVFTPVTGVIFANQGTIDKYVGDMVMAFWGAPLRDPAHRTHAVKAALQILAVVAQLKPRLREQGLPAVEVGIGINTGMMNVGDMGSTWRRAYTVLGDAVNLGSRLESLTKVYGVGILIGENTYAELQGIVCREVDKVQVKGRTQALRIYQPLCSEADASAALLADLQQYNAAYSAYQQQEWDTAERLFTALRQQDAETRLYAIYLARIADLRTQSLPRDWDGTFRHASK